INTLEARIKGIDEFRLFTSEQQNLRVREYQDEFSKEDFNWTPTFPCCLLNLEKGEFVKSASNKILRKDINVGFFVARDDSKIFDLIDSVMDNLTNLNNEVIDGKHITANVMNWIKFRQINQIFVYKIDCVFTVAN
ncbi:MAG TPA: hypothetical protein PLG90_13100, partial [Ignavibacteria bacterium]|nr:hypothetical protein [Ignavibacteria bacterium]